MRGCDANPFPDVCCALYWDVLLQEMLRGLSMSFHYPIWRYESGPLSSLLLWSCLGGDHPSYIGTGVMNLIYGYVMWVELLCFNTATMIISVFNKLFWWHKCQPWVPSFPELPKPLDTSPWLESCVGDYWGYSHISTRIISWELQCYALS